MSFPSLKDQQPPLMYMYPNNKYVTIHFHTGARAGQYIKFVRYIYNFFYKRYGMKQYG